MADGLTWEQTKFQILARLEALEDLLIGYDGDEDPVRARRRQDYEEVVEYIAEAMKGGAQREARRRRSESN